MVIVRIGGGLGNQFFQYAFAKSYSIKNQCDVLIDISAFKNRRINNNLSTAVPHSYYCLKLYRTKLKIATEPQCAYVKSMAANKDLSNSGLRKLFSKHKVPAAYLITNPSASSELFDFKGNVYFQGTFGREKFFKEYRDELLKDLELDISLDAKNIEMLEKIKTTNSASVHIRLGDYVRIGWDLPVSYYLDAIQYLIEKEKNIHFYIFSNEIAWVKENLKIDAPYTIVDINPPNKGYYDLELMKNCKHNIIANSTFSWWAAWLNQHPEKTILVPEPWNTHPRFYDGITDKCKDLAPESWIRIKRI